MKIFYARRQFATNSSSSHSIIFFNGDASEISSKEDGDFGWDTFTLANETSKRHYLTAILQSALARQVGHETAKLFFKEDIGQIDHQSTWTLPREWNGKGIDPEFWEDFQQFILRKDIIVLGGHDNGDHGIHPLASQGKEALPSNYPQETDDEYVARKDSNYWTIFNRTNGDKLRLTFDPSVEKPVRASLPELVDLKITDYCPFNCDFCYMGSTTKGKHADLKETLSPILAGLHSARVFEIAIGGGEPTLHPNFIAILEETRRNHIIPNFTTKNFSFFNNDNKATRDKALDLCGAFAFSVQTIEDLYKIRSLISEGCIPPDKLVIQHIVGVDESIDKFREFLATLVEPLKGKVEDDRVYDAWFLRRLTLLGFKTTGRGVSFAVNEIPPWITLVKEAQKRNEICLHVAIDTVLASKHFDQLKQAGVSDIFLGRKDGEFSLYIDAVEGYIASSSYELDINGRIALPTNKVDKWRTKDEVIAWKLPESLKMAMNI